MVQGAVLASGPSEGSQLLAGRMQPDLNPIQFISPLQTCVP